MSFPKLETPVLSCILPVSGKKVKYRPYTVKEDKILNLVMTEDDEAKQIEDMLDVVAELIKACTFNELSADDLCVPDMEYLFIKIKAASSGSIRKKIYTCKMTDADGNECNAENIVELDLNKIKLTKSKPEKLVKLNDELTLSMKAPTFASVRKSMQADDGSDTNSGLHMMAASVEMVLHGDEVYTDFTNDEIIDNILINMTEEQSQAVKKYFDDLPELVFTKRFTCKACKSKHDLEVKHLANFFG